MAKGGFDHSWIIEDHNNFFAPKKASLDDKPFPMKPDPNFYLTTFIANQALGFLGEHEKQHQAEPFFLYLAFTSPHFPLMAPAADIALCKGRYDAGWDVLHAQRFKRQQELKIIDCALAPMEPDIIPGWNASPEKLEKNIGPGEVARSVPWMSLTPVQQRFQAQKMEIHAAMIERMDKEIGRVLDQVAKMGAADNTLVMFVSDNGASAEEIIRGGGNSTTATPGSADSFLCMGPGWASAANTPYRLYKTYVHEGGTSSPAIVSWPAGIKAQGELRHGAAHFVDIVPTLLEVAGAPLEVKPGGPAWPGRSLLPGFASDGKLTPEPIFFLHIGNAALRVGNWKLVRLGKSGPWELYDLSKDRCEQVNLAKAQPERVSEMAKEWERREAEYRQQAGPATKGKKGQTEEQ